MDQETFRADEEAGYYKSCFQQIEDELRHLDLLLHYHVIMARREGGGDEFRGLYISDEEIDGILENQTEEDDQLPDIRGLMAQSGSLKEARKENSRKKGIRLRLPAIEETYGLTKFESQALVICLAPELDKKYEKLYAYLQDDATRRRPSVGLVLDLLCESQEERAAARQYFDSGSTLIKNGLIRFSEGNGSQLSGSLLSKSIEIDGKIVSYILGLDSTGRGEAEAPGTKLRLEDLDLTDDLSSSASNLIRRIMANSDAICLLQGYYGSGKRRLAEAICNELGLNCLDLDVSDLGPDAESSLDNARSPVASIFREARLWGAAVYLHNFDSLFQESGPGGPGSPNTLKSAFFEAILEFNGPIFLASQRSIDLGRRWQSRLFSLDLPVPDYPVRKRLWLKLLDTVQEEEMIVDLASKFRFTAGQIEDAVAAATNIAILQGRETPSQQDLYEGCRSQSKSTLSLLAKRIKPRYSWEDIVLPADKIEQLKDIRNHIRYRGLVYNDWGFERKLSLGKGLNALFTGPSGTGKTMAAEVVARDLGLDLYKIDLSSIISKYIGETEKNLERIFKEAEQSNAMLFFDEADALFGKRSEVKDSHDRYANIEVSYLLQKMEEHEGIAILASNLGCNIDDAFMRRMNFLIEFPFPEEDNRCRIWQGMMPKGAPVAEDVDYEFLSRRFKIAGGNIKNIIVNSAFAAADDSGIITMTHIVNATRKELQKMGKACSQNDFGKYCNLIKID